MVFSGLVTACRLATSPTRRSPLLLTATMDGVVRAPSALGITTGSPPSMTATHELVVPRSIPITFGIIASYVFNFSMKFRLFFEAVHLCQQFVHHLCHITHDGDSSSVLHAGRADDAQQAADFAFLPIARDYQAYIAHLIPLILASDNHLNAVRGAQVRGQDG